MKRQPTLRTERLRLRPFVAEDAPRVRELASAREIARTTLNIPHPYEAGVAETWIASHKAGFATGKQVTFAIVVDGSGDLIGSIGLRVNRDHDRAELGYWIGVDYWSRGFGTEAARAVLSFGFQALELNRIYATHFQSNPASGRIMEKIGMTYEGVMRQHVLKWGGYEDLAIYGVLREDFLAWTRSAEQ